MACNDDDGFILTFPAMRGIQAGREYYVAMCPMKHIPKLIRLSDAALSVEQKAQRILNKARIPALVQYVLENADNYIFSSLTASVDGEAKFTPLGDDKVTRRLSLLRHAPRHRCCTGGRSPGTLAQGCPL